MKRYIRSSDTNLSNTSNIIDIENPDAKITRLDKYISQYGLNFVYMAIFIYYLPEWKVKPPYSNKIAEVGVSEDELNNMVNYLYRAAVAYTTSNETVFHVGRKLRYGNISHEHRIYTGDYQVYKRWLNN